MKNTIRLFGIIAIVAMIGFTMAACEQDEGPKNDSSTNGRLTITGLSSYNGWTANAIGYIEGFNFTVTPTSTDPTPGNLTVNGGSVTFCVWNWTNVAKNYTGNDQNHKFFVELTNGGERIIGTVTVNFSNGIGTGPFVLDSN
jgi:ABC-type proline/glycine betaine transport system substrate-binding protein